MESMTLHNVSEIAESDRAALEHLVGRPLSAEQQVVILTYTPGVADETTRAAARESLARTLAAAAQRAAERGVTAEEADAAVDEAMRHVRPSYQ
jgi:type IV pilus biogenesis protein CpaD/CtpE